MPIYRIAELNIKLEPAYQETIDRLAPYLAEGEEYDFAVSPDRDAFEEFCARSGFPNSPGANEGPYLYTLICRKILSDYDGFFFFMACRRRKTCR